MENQIEDPLTIENIFKVLKEEPEVLDDPIRMAIFFMVLKRKDVTVEDLRSGLNIKGNTIYYHLKKLERVGIISVKKEAVQGTNLNRKVCSINPLLFKEKNDPGWKEIVQNNLKSAFMIEMHLAAAAVMEGIQKYRTMSEEMFHKYYKDEKPQCDVLFLKKDQFLEFRALINRFIQDNIQSNISQIFEQSEGYVYSIFAYPPISFDPRH